MLFLPPQLDPEDPVHKEIMDLIYKGLVEYGFNDEGEMMLSLTEAGKEIAEEIGDEEE